MFAQYTVKTRGKQAKYLGLSALYFEIKLGKVQHKIELETLSKVLLEKRKKLAPLIAGGILTSLSLLSIILYGSSIEMVGLIGFGLLLTYYGITEYTVIRLEYASTNELVWLPISVTLESIRPFAALLEFYINRKQFPILYASPVVAEDSRLMHYETTPVKSSGTIIYQFGQATDNRMPQLAVNPALLDHTLEIEGQGKVIAEGDHLINQSAVVDYNSINLS